MYMYMAITTKPSCMSDLMMSQSFCCYHNVMSFNAIMLKSRLSGVYKTGNLGDVIKMSRMLNSKLAGFEECGKVDVLKLA